MDQVAITYPATTLNTLTGAGIKTIMEDVCDNLFNADPYYQQGGDMVRVGGVRYSVTPNAGIGHRINDMTLNGQAIDPNKKYKVAGWAPVGEGVKGAPIWDVVAEYLREVKVIKQVKLNQPKVIGMGNNPGMVL